MRVRAIDEDHDWLFGKGQNDYRRDLDALVQNLNTRLLSVVGDCWFDLGAGVDWFNFIGSKDQIGLKLAIATVILNTQFVTGVLELNASLDAQGRFLVSYIVQSGFGTASSSFNFDTTIVG